MGKIRAYTSGSSSVLSFLLETSSLYRYSRDASERAQESIQDIRRREALINHHLGVELHNLDILEIGPGQYQAHATYLAARNRLVGIDLEVMPRASSPLSYLKILKTNGFRRTAKTLGRKLLGIDRKFARELRRQIGVKQLPTPKIIQMDACQMSFPDESFDFVYARSVFHHLPDPSAAIDGVVRVLRPGGSIYILLHLYTSETGCLDPRIYTTRADEVKGWPHLRPALAATLHNESTYLNKLRLCDWRALFESKLPNAKYFTTGGKPATVELAQALQSKGELLDYSLEELTTYDLAVMWQKPA